MQAQLGRWSARIDQLAAGIENAGSRATIGEHQRVDELRVCRVIAQARLDEYRTAGEERRQGLEDSVAQAWGDLAAAMKKLKGQGACR